LMGKINL